MLRALPPGAPRRSRTTTSKPRSASSWAAVMPAIPPPSTRTLAIVQPVKHVGDVDVALHLELLHRHPADSEALEAVQPLPVGVGGHERRGGVERGAAAVPARDHVGVPVRPEVEYAAGPVEDERSVGRLVGGPDVDDADAVSADAHPVAAVTVHDGVDPGTADRAAVDEEVDPVGLPGLAEPLGPQVDGERGEELQVVAPTGDSG